MSMGNKINFKLLKKLSKEKWYIEHADARPFFISPYVRAFVRGLHPASYSIVLSYYCGGKMDWMTLRKDQRRLYNKVINKQKKDNHYWQKIFEKWLTRENKFRQLYYKLIYKNIKAISDSELLKDIKKYFDFVDKSRRFSSIIDPLTFVVEIEFKETLTEPAKKYKIDVNKAYNILTAPEYPSFLSTRDVELANISNRILKTKKRINKKTLMADDQIFQKIQTHTKKYLWINRNSFTAGSGTYNLDEVIEEMKRIIKKGPEKVIRKNKNYLANRRKRRKYLEEHKFNKDIIMISGLIVLFTRWQDFRKENTLMASHLNTKYVDEIARRKKINKNIITYLNYSELDDLFKNKLNISRIKNRNKGALFAFIKNDFRVFTDKSTLNLITENIIKKENGKSEIKGTGVSLGMVTGKVMVLKSFRDLNKMKKGNILVATMTRPEHIIALRKAKAIVTDEGGITCHAAIVSREFNIPCIIGTKIATKVLKDGDLVEVDANKGVVKIIKKAK